MVLKCELTKSSKVNALKFNKNELKMLKWQKKMAIL
jgi:hypothetical protein